MIDDQQDQICGIIDFGDMVHAPLIYDVAIALAYHLGGEDEDTLAIMVDFENKIHKMKFRKGGKFVFEKIEGKYKFFWNDKDLVYS